MIVAIDGPAGAGKGTVARALADRLGFDYVDTGAMYRAVTLAALRSDVAVDDAEALAKLAAAVRIDVAGERVFLGREDVTDRIRDDEVTRRVSAVAAHGGVRDVLLDVQRALLARGGNLVMEGRDIGTRVAPHADLKIFLTASLDERARRRVRQVGDTEDEPTLAAARTAMAARDQADAARRVSPFEKAGDAIEIDSTGRSIDDVVAEVAGLVRERSDRAH